MDISTEVAAIQAASQGSELRQPLVDALNKLNSSALPAVTSSDAGKILKVDSNGNWVAGEKSGYMPIPIASLNITENGTVNVLNYSEAIVAVSGGGVELMLRSAWDALTTAQKQAKGLVAIQDYSTGFNRGILVNGADYIAPSDYIPYSDIENIICESYLNNFDSSQSIWGSGTNPINFSGTLPTVNSDNSIYIQTKTLGTLAYVDLLMNNTSFTAYLVAKSVSGSGTYTRLLFAQAQRSSRQGVNSYGNPITFSTWGDSNATSVSSTSYFVLALQFEKKGSGCGAALNSLSGQPEFKTLNPSTAGRYITIGRSDIDPSTHNAEPTDMNVLYFGVVNEAESQSVITQNMQHLAQTFSSYLSA